ncbi:hypothetical protein OG402_33865 [Streptomyces anulatus]|uniref:hypothetical protein n=1 Tax=Streptomyces anulatus TaxID=1892 RepID=UPI002257F4B5|nr:hypothetical protein [Streptomyces anulatus]MCX4605456.1 hypothetical protein [Streptomyces anulatus]
MSEVQAVLAQVDIPVTVHLLSASRVGEALIVVTEDLHRERRYMVDVFRPDGSGWARVWQAGSGDTAMVPQMNRDAVDFLNGVAAQPATPAACRSDYQAGADVRAQMARQEARRR